MRRHQGATAARLWHPGSAGSHRWPTGQSRASGRASGAVGGRVACCTTLRHLSLPVEHERRGRDDDRVDALGPAGQPVSNGALSQQRPEHRDGLQRLACVRAQRGQCGTVRHGSRLHAGRSVQLHAGASGCGGCTRGRSAAAPARAPRPMSSARMQPCPREPSLRLRQHS